MPRVAKSTTKTAKKAAPKKTVKKPVAPPKKIVKKTAAKKIIKKPAPKKTLQQQREELATELAASGLEELELADIKTHLKTFGEKAIGKQSVLLEKLQAKVDEFAPQEESEPTEEEVQQQREELATELAASGLDDLELADIKAHLDTFGFITRGVKGGKVALAEKLQEKVEEFTPAGEETEDVDEVEDIDLEDEEPPNNQYEDLAVELAASGLEEMDLADIKTHLKAFGEKAVGTQAALLKKLQAKVDEYTPIPVEDEETEAPEETTEDEPEPPKAKKVVKLKKVEDAPLALPAGVRVPDVTYRISATDLADIFHTANEEETSTVKLFKRLFAELSPFEVDEETGGLIELVKPKLKNKHTGADHFVGNNAEALRKEQKGKKPVVPQEPVDEPEEVEEPEEVAIELNIQPKKPKAPRLNVIYNEDLGVYLDTNYPYAWDIESKSVFAKVVNDEVVPLQKSDLAKLTNYIRPWHVVVKKRDPAALPTKKEIEELLLVNKADDSDTDDEDDAATDGPTDHHESGPTVTIEGEGNDDGVEVEHTSTTTSTTTSTGSSTGGSTGSGRGAVSTSNGTKAADTVTRVEKESKLTMDDEPVIDEATFTKFVSAQWSCASRTDVRAISQIAGIKPSLGEYIMLNIQMLSNVYPHVVTQVAAQKSKPAIAQHAAAKAPPQRRLLKPAPKA